MASTFFSAWKQIAGGKTLMRSLMNNSLKEYSLEKGVVVDLGGGNNPSYMNFFKDVSGAQFKNIDTQYGKGENKAIDFEKDSLPYGDETVDQVLMLNVLEHIYNHNFFASEAFRILKKGKTIIGFVPFIINYHPDPHDYFRYTDEALQKIFEEIGFSEVEIKTVGVGPFSINFNTLASFMPRFFNTVVWPFYYILDSILLMFKPGLTHRFPLGYIFILKK